MDKAMPRLKPGTKLKKLTKATGLYTLAGWVAKRNQNAPAIVKIPLPPRERPIQ